MTIFSKHRLSKTRLTNQIQILYTCIKVFFTRVSKTVWPNEDQLHVEYPWFGVTNVCSVYLIRMTIMAALPINVKKYSKMFISRIKWPTTFKPGM